MTNASIAQGKFVYPFIFDVNSFDNRYKQLNLADTETDSDKKPIWEATKYSEQDLLPHVAKYINADLNNEKNNKLFNVGIWRLNNDVLQSAKYGLGSGRENGSVTYKLIFPNGATEFDILNVELYLFRTGMGAIAFEVKPRLRDHNPDDWFDFLNYFRFYGGFRGVSLECTKTTGYNKIKDDKVIIPYFPSLGFTNFEQKDGIGVFGEIISDLLYSGRLEGETKNWWQDVFIPQQFIPFTMLFLQEAPKEKIPQFVYQYRKMFHSRQVLIPPKYELSLDHASLYHYTENQWFVFSLDGGGFISFDPPTEYFFAVELPIHLMDQYFLIFILTIHQRFVLTRLADKVVHVWLTEREEDEDEFYLFEQLQTIFKAFASLGNYNQVMQRDNLHQVYQKWQEVFQIDLLYQSVNKEIEHISNFLQSKQDQTLKQIEEAQHNQTRRLERQINIIMYLIGIPAIIFPFIEMVDNKGFLYTFLLLIGGIIIGGLLLFLMSRRKPK